MTLFDNVALGHRSWTSELGVDNRTIDFDVYLPDFQLFCINKKAHCMRERVINHATDIFVLFVSTFIRVNLNTYFKFFLSVPLTLSDEKYSVRQIQNCVRDMVNEIWLLNVNYFFVIFYEFTKHNRSLCYDIKAGKKNSYEPLFQPPGSYEYFGELSVVPRANYQLFRDDSSDFDSDLE